MLLIDVWGIWFCLFVKPVTSMRLLTKGNWFTKMAKLVFLLLFSEQTGLYPKATNSHLKPVVFTPTVKSVFLSHPKVLRWTRKSLSGSYLLGLEAASPWQNPGAPLAWGLWCWQEQVSHPRCPGRQGRSSPGQAGQLPGSHCPETRKSKQMPLARTGELLKWRCGVTFPHPSARKQDPLVCHHQQCWGSYTLTLLFKNWTLE